MADYYVAPGDSLSEIIATALAGDTVHLSTGTHTGQLGISGRTYTSDNPLSIVADEGAVLLGGVLVQNSSGIWLENLVVHDTADDHGGIYLYNVDDCVAVGCVASDIPMSTTHAGFRMRYVTNCLIYQCEVLRCARGFETTHAVGCVWRECRAVDCREAADDADGFVVYEIDSEYNAFVDCESTGCCDDGYDNWTSSHNVLVRCVASLIDPHDGNGFKLGGSAGTSGGHIVIDCISENNTEVGFTNNSGPRPSLLIGCVAMGNGADGFEEFGDAEPSTYYNCIATGNGVDWDVSSGAIRNDNHVVTIDDFPAWLDNAPSHIRDIAILAIGEEPVDPPPVEPPIDPPEENPIMGAVADLQVAVDTLVANVTVQQEALVQVEAANVEIVASTAAIETAMAGLQAADVAADVLAEQL